MTQNFNRIFIIGGTGHYGQHIVRSLLSRNVRLKLLTRNVGHARNLFGDQVEIVNGSIEDLDTLKKTFQNTDRIIYSISAMSVSQIRRLHQIEQDAVISSFQLARTMGIKRVVYISVFEINREVAEKNHLATANEKAMVEDFLSKSDFNWTILGAPPSMEIFFSMIRGTKMMVPGGGPKGLPTVSPADVGEIVAQTILRDDLSAMRIKMTAPQAYSFPDAAARISKIWGKEIKYQKIPILFPKIAYFLTTPLCPFSDKMLYIHTLLGFIRLLNNFPEQYIHEVPKLHQNLMSLFSYSPSTIEIEAERRRI